MIYNQLPFVIYNYCNRFVGLNVVYVATLALIIILGIFLI